ARWVAEKVGAPNGQDRCDPAERLPDEEENERRHREARDERIALAVDRHKLRADGGKHRHGRRSYSAAACLSSGKSGSGSSTGSSAGGGLRFGAVFSASARARVSRASSASRWRRHMLA